MILTFIIVYIDVFVYLDFILNIARLYSLFDFAQMTFTTSFEWN